MLFSSSTSSVRRRARVTDALVRDIACSVTDRDRQILRLIRWHRVLTTSQVAMMFFTDRNTAQHRLTRLYDLRLVERFRPFQLGCVDEYHYVLDKLGAYLVAAMSTDDLDVEPRIRWRTDQALAIAQSQRLVHTVGANDLFVRLIGAARGRDNVSLDTWWGEHYCKSRFGGIVNPDGCGVWQEGGDVVTFMLEYDRGTESLGRLAHKAKEYADLETVWQFRPFWVLAVVPGQRRERGVMAALSGEGLACATTTTSLATTPDGPIWAPPGADGTRVRLIDLATWPRPSGSRTRYAEADAYRAKRKAEEEAWQEKAKQWAR